MLPYISLFGRSIGMYQIMALAGIFATGIYVCRVCRRNKFNDNEAIVFLLVSAIGVFFGGHLLYAIINFKELKNIINYNYTNYWQLFITILFTVFGGSIFYGGLLGGIAAASIYLHKKPECKYLVDIVSPAIPLFHFFGRIGCFLGGCCFGIESQFGFVFKKAIIEEANGISRFPVQIMEAVFNIILFVILNSFRKNNMFKNQLLYVYLLLYSTGRFFIEFLRGDAYRGILLVLSTSQIISIIIFIAALYKIIRSKQKETVR